MAWSRTRSESRIKTFRQSVPEGQIDVRSFDQTFLDARRKFIAEEARSGRPGGSLIAIPPSKAVLVDGVHVYLQLLDYHDRLLELGRETEKAHQGALQLLHLHYSGCDRVIGELGAQRVDFHGPRLHAVVVAPTGTQGERDRVLNAITLATSLKQVIEEAGARVSGGRYRTRVRVGIDTGQAVAVNSGRADEQEPLFLGNPANYAAKLADGDDEGIFLSNRARAVLGLHRVGSIVEERRHDIRNTLTIGGLTTPVLDRIVDEAKAAIEVAPAVPKTFTFHHHEPPLRTIRFGDLVPSNSIRMPLTSIFADIDGFTRYVETCITQGRVRELVSNLHVIRKELAAVLKEDFDGRKVRFIGDCIHGLLAEGTRTSTNEKESVRSAVFCAGGLRSSFNLCRQLLPGIQNLGLAIGIELGPTPITRLGLRGDYSVRCATSRAVSMSEELQSGCEGTSTALGTAALSVAPDVIRRTFTTAGGKIQNLDYAAAVRLFDTAPTIVAPSTGREATFRPYLDGGE
ncbi:adenylate/guanylate cyclase domain-containing protein [Salinarimonas sp. NSM]|uniref:adenylate/guanylate cyclase domain-containing protein n=1 Tax=Salinarimonas sp. NSM TaxID=3458003 RepID=UPI004035CDF3